MLYSFYGIIGETVLLPTMPFSDLHCATPAAWDIRTDDCSDTRGSNVRSKQCIELAGFTKAVISTGRFEARQFSVENSHLPMGDSVVWGVLLLCLHLLCWLSHRAESVLEKGLTIVSITYGSMVGASSGVLTKRATEKASDYRHGGFFRCWRFGDTALSLSWYVLIRDRHHLCSRLCRQPFAQPAVNNRQSTMTPHALLEITGLLCGGVVFLPARGRLRQCSVNRFSLCYFVLIGVGILHTITEIKEMPVALDPFYRNTECGLRSNPQTSATRSRMTNMHGDMDFAPAWSPDCPCMPTCPARWQSCWEESGWSGARQRHASFVLCMKERKFALPAR
jgi:hypothetical protein